MGYQNQGIALVIMTNSDVYYISLADKDRLNEQLQKLHKPISFTAQDARKGSELEIFIEHISSIVVEGK